MSGREFKIDCKDCEGTGKIPDLVDGAYLPCSTCAGKGARVLVTSDENGNAGGPAADFMCALQLVEVIASVKFSSPAIHAEFADRLRMVAAPAHQKMADQRCPKCGKMRPGKSWPCPECGAGVPPACPLCNKSLAEHPGGFYCPAP